MKSTLVSFMIFVQELLSETSERIKLNPLYAIPYIFLIGVIILTLILGLGVFTIPPIGIPQ